MNAVIYSTGLDELFPLTKVRLKSMLPILNRPILEHQIEQLRKSGAREIKIVLHKFPEQVDNYFSNGENFDILISYSLEKQITGTFKCLRKFQTFLKEPFLFCNCNSFNKMNYRALIQQHADSGAAITVAVAKLNPLRDFQKIDFDSDGNIVAIKNINKTETDKSVWLNTQVYICNPELMEYLKEGKINSIENDLLPYLLNANKKIMVFKVATLWEPITQLSYYWHLNINLMREIYGIMEIPGTEIRPGIYAGKNSTIATTIDVNLKGPILIGENTEIEKNVTIYGPAIIGHNVKIDAGATINQSVICDNSYIGKMTEVNNSVVDKGWHISVPNLFATFIEEEHILGEFKKSSFKISLNKFLINLFDRTAALIGLICLSPVLLITAILIKLDSRGPVFYVSERLKRPESKSKDEGHYQFLKKESVKYYVFRTMYQDADKRLLNIETKNVYESGPYNKFDNDPRVTCVGKILRKLSLDEMPLLLNVLKGDMSLVGIWALPTYEAEHLERQGLKAGELDLSEVARMRFHGKLGLAGYWQARGRSNLSAEERALHDSFQSVFATGAGDKNGNLGEYGEMVSFRGYLKILLETFLSVIKCRGAQ